MKKFFKYILTTILLLVCIIDLLAISASPYPVKITQPDGTELTIKLCGDEYHHYRTTLDGYLILPNTKGVFTYAVRDNDGTFHFSNVKATEIEKRSIKEKKFIKTLTRDINFRETNNLRRASKAPAINLAPTAQKSYPLTGSPKSLVILVNFSENRFTVSNPQSAFTNLLNLDNYSANGGTGSARDYFRSASNGVFSPQFDVVGPYTLPQTMAFYGANDANGNDKNPQQMVVDACRLAFNAGINFSQYDTDNNGNIDNVFIYYAGNNEAEHASANTIWPHRWSLSSAGISVSDRTFDGKIVNDYACTSELRAAAGSNMCGIGTFCHEFGHVLGLPDYYATNGATHHTLSYWNIMDAGAYLNDGNTPPTYSAYDRFYLDWLKPTELKSAQNVTLQSLTSSNTAYIITLNGNHNLVGSSPNPQEFFTLENRQKTGWDAYLPGHGLLITRINYNSSTWYNNTPNNNPGSMGVDIIEADGIPSVNNLSGDAFPGADLKIRYSPALSSGTKLDKPISSIKETNGIISFNFMNEPIVKSTNTLSSFNTVHGTASGSQILKIYGEKLEDSLHVSFVQNKHFEMKLESDTQWKKYIALAPSNSIVDTTRILIRYNPTEPSFTDMHYETLTLSSNNAETSSIAITGKSTRPVYVVPPVANNASDIIESSFVANWESVYDASGYYLTVYSITDGESAQTQGFKNGITAPAGWIINAASSTSSTAYSGDSIPAIQLKTTGEYIQTEVYNIPTSGLSFFTKSMGGTSGSILVEAYDGSVWSILDNISITSSLAGTKSYTFSESNNYIQFRLTFTKGAGYVSVDDISAKFSKQVGQILTDKWVTSNSETINNLLPNTNHFYKVKASDKTLNTNKSIKYENITGFSNTISVKTLEDKNPEALRTAIQTDGSVYVIMPESSETIYVFNTVGQKIKEISENKSIVHITDLPTHQVYILQAGKRRAKIIL